MPPAPHVFNQQFRKKFFIHLMKWTSVCENLCLNKICLRCLESLLRVFMVPQDFLLFLPQQAKTAMPLELVKFSTLGWIYSCRILQCPPQHYHRQMSDYRFCSLLVLLSYAPDAGCIWMQTYLIYNSQNNAQIEMQLSETHTHACTHKHTLTSLIF